MNLHSALLAIGCRGRVGDIGILTHLAREEKRRCPHEQRDNHNKQHALVYEAKHAQHARNAFANVARQATGGVDECRRSRATGAREKRQLGHERPCHDFHAHKRDHDGNLRALGPFGKQEGGEHLAHHENLIEARERNAAMQQDARGHDNHAREHGRQRGLPAKIIKRRTRLGECGPDGEIRDADCRKHARRNGFKRHAQQVRERHGRSLDARTRRLTRADRLRHNRANHQGQQRLHGTHNLGAHLGHNRASQIGKHVRHRGIHHCLPGAYLGIHFAACHQQECKRN